MEAGVMESIQRYGTEVEAALRSSWLWLSLAIGFILLQILSTRKLRARWPPGPPALPILGCLLSLPLDQPKHQSFTRLAEKYGSLMYFPMGMRPNIVVSSAEMAKLVLKDMDRIWASRPPLMVGKYLGFDYKSLIFTEMNDHHRRLKRLFKDVLFSPQRVASSASIRENEWSRGVSSILKAHDENPHKPVNLTKFIENVVINTVLLVVVGEEIGLEKVAKLKSMIKVAMGLAGETGLSDFIPFLRFFPGAMDLAKRMKEEADNQLTFFKEIIAQGRLRMQRADREGVESELGRPISHCLLDVLLSLEGSERPTDDEITSWLLDSIIPGTDTNVGATDWIMAEVFRSPHTVKRAVEELDSVVGRDRMVLTSDIPNLPFIHSIVKEALRLHAPTPLTIPHMSMEACEIQGYQIPAKTMVMVNLWAVGRDGKYWKDPLLFNPDRFMDTNSDILGQTFEVLPFSSGRRGCVGRLMAIAVQHLNVATMLHCFEWTVEGEVDMTESIGLSSPREKPLICFGKPRLPPRVYEGLLSDRQDRLT